MHDTGTLAERFGACIKEARTANGLTQLDLAKVLGVTERYAAGLERAEYNLSFAAAEGIAQRLGIELGATLSDPLKLKRQRDRRS